jgi:hypothetical protein
MLRIHTEHSWGSNETHVDAAALGRVLLLLFEGSFEFEMKDRRPPSGEILDTEVRERMSLSAASKIKDSPEGGRRSLSMLSAAGRLRISSLPLLFSVSSAPRW